MSSSKRARPQVRPPRGADVFVMAADKPRPAPKASGGGRKRRGVLARPRGEVDRITAYLPLELGQRLRVHCVGERVELSIAIAEAIEAYLGRGKASGS
jgi:hypothetical protein